MGLTSRRRAGRTERARSLMDLYARAEKRCPFSETGEIAPARSQDRAGASVEEGLQPLVMVTASLLAKAEGAVIAGAVLGQAVVLQEVPGQPELLRVAVVLPGQGAVNWTRGCCCCPPRCRCSSGRSRHKLEQAARKLAWSLGVKVTSRPFIFCAPVTQSWMELLSPESQERPQAVDVGLTGQQIAGHHAVSGKLGVVEGGGGHSGEVVGLAVVGQGLDRPAAQGMAGAVHPGEVHLDTSLLADHLVQQQQGRQVMLTLSSSSP